MTTGAEEVTTVDERQLCFAGVVGGPLTLTFDPQGSYIGRGYPITTGAQEMMTINNFNIILSKTVQKEYR